MKHNKKIFFYLIHMFSCCVRVSCCKNPSTARSYVRNKLHGHGVRTFQRWRAFYARELNASRFFCHIGRSKTHGRNIGEQCSGSGSWPIRILHVGRMGYSRSACSSV